ncbi:MAG TPA: NUDIX domain-containing protein [Chloroflexia bacterium]|nr:NUDIX domain-containing protein [Chloroflexia bacterium]
MECGAPLALLEQGVHEAQWTCTNPSCGRVHYRNAKPCAGALIEQDGAVLLVRRNIEPFSGYWDIPGGYLQEWEHPADGARREVQEETGLEVELTRLLGIFVDSYGSEGSNTFNVYYRARPVGGHLQPADDAAEARWFPPDSLPANIAFPGHIPDVLAAWRAALAAEPHPDPAADPALAVHVAAAVRRSA